MKHYFIYTLILLVLFSCKASTRHSYHQLFDRYAKKAEIEKTYLGVANVPSSISMKNKSWLVENCIAASQPRFLRCIDKHAKPNSLSLIKCLRQSGEKALFELKPITGKTHQLRLHMMSIGYPLINDGFYPKLLPSLAGEAAEYAKPLQLLAQKISFIDPISNKSYEFNSRNLLDYALF